MTEPWTVHVVVPAHNEERRVGRCVRAVNVAVAALRSARPDVMVTTTLVLDRCTDQTRARAQESAGEHAWGVLEIDAGCVGAARHAGIAHAVATTAVIAPETTWVVTSDADSLVGSQWLVDHLALAEHHDLVIGRVEPDPDELTGAALAEWRRRHTIDGHHVHGANLGVRLSTYLAAGGFPPVAQHEDVLLAEAVISSGARWIQDTLVTTSARHVGRAPGGFSRYMLELDKHVCVKPGAGEGTGNRVSARVAD